MRTLLILIYAINSLQGFSQNNLPAIKIKTLAGQEISFNNLSVNGDTLLVVSLWATWCIPCIQEHAALTAAARTNPDVTFLGVVYEDTRENALNFLAQRGSAYNSYADEDGKAAIAFGVYGVPETFFIDAAGTIVDKYVGPLDDDTIFAKLAAARK